MCRRPFEVGRPAISGRSPGWRGGELRARRPALRGAWPGRPARLAPGAPSPAGWRGPRRRDFCEWRLRRGRGGGRFPLLPTPGGRVAVVVMDVSRGVSVRGSAFGRWDERVAAPPACPPPPPPTPPPRLSLRPLLASRLSAPLPSSSPGHWSALRGPEHWPRLSLRAGAARARGARVPRVPRVPPPSPGPAPPATPAPCAERQRLRASPFLD